MVKGKDIRNTFGKTVQELRLAHNMSQEKLAELGDLDRSYISEIENGNKTASVVTLYKIALALEMKPSRLVQEMEKHFKFE